MDIPTPEEVMQTLSEPEKKDVQEVCDYIVINLRRYNGEEMQITLDSTYHVRVKREVERRFAVKGWTVKWGNFNSHTKGWLDAAIVSATPRLAYEYPRESIMTGSQEDR